MTNCRPQTWEDVVGEMPRLLQDLESGEMRQRIPLGKVPQKGIYVFYENDRPIYVGRTNRMRLRILEHGRASSTHNSASFAFLLAVEQAEKKGMDCKNRNRNELEQDPKFAPLFTAAKERVRRMGIRVVAIDDAVEQTLFEVYAAMSLGTMRQQGGYNDFENH